jgi:hypothetical protein
MHTKPFEITPILNHINALGAPNPRFHGPRTGHESFPSGSKVTSAIRFLSDVVFISLQFREPLENGREILSRPMTNFLTGCSFSWPIDWLSIWCPVSSASKTTISTQRRPPKNPITSPNLWSSTFRKITTATAVCRVSSLGLARISNSSLCPKSPGLIK